MNKELKNKWVAALRSGSYRQTQHKLRRMGDSGVSYCCLGVLACVSGQHFPGSSVFKARSLYSGDALDLLNGDRAMNDKLSAMNDGGGLSFAEIADWIEKNVPVDA